MTETGAGALAAFLDTRLDEDEKIARDAVEHGSETEHRYHAGLHGTLLGGIALGSHHYRHNAARVLREVEAKRRITAEIARGVEYEAEPLADMVLGFLALPYSDHPDYRDEWKP